MQHSPIHKDHNIKPRYFEVHGFKVPMTPDGRRIWSPKFKKYVIEKILKGELKTKDIAKRCKVHPSVLQQWRNDIETYASDDFEREELYPPLEVLGFIVPRMNNGKRIWPPELKKLAIEKLHSKEMTAVEIALECQIDSSVVYQWKLEMERKVKKKHTKKKPERQSQVLTELIKLDEQVEEEADGSKSIFLRVGNLAITLPSDYPTSRLVSLCKELA